MRRLIRYGVIVAAGAIAAGCTAGSQSSTSGGSGSGNKAATDLDLHHAPFGAISCGPPAIRPFAMPGPKIDNPSSARGARISVSASEMVGGSLKPEV